MGQAAADHTHKHTHTQPHANVTGMSSETYVKVLPGLWVALEDVLHNVHALHAEGGGGGGLLEFASGKQQSCRTGTDHALALAPALHVFVALLDNGCALLRRDLVVGRLQPLQTSQRLGDLRGGVPLRLVKGKCACRSARAYLLLDIGKLLLRILVGELRGQRLVLFVIGEKGVRPTEG